VILLEPLDILKDPIGLLVGLLGVVLPIDPEGFASNISRKINQVSGAGILDIEESPLPLPT
jgi:hypothetical protein